MQTQAQNLEVIAQQYGQQLARAWAEVIERSNQLRDIGYAVSIHQDSAVKDQVIYLSARTDNDSRKVKEAATLQLRRIGA